MPQVPSSTLGKVSSNESNPLKADYNLPEVGASPTPTPDPTTNFAPAIDEAFIPPKPVIQMKQNEIPEGEIVPEYNYEDVSVRAARAKEYGKTPEMAARIFNVEDRTGLPTAFIEQNLEDLEKEADQQGFSVSHFASKNPKLAEWLSKNSNNYALAKDDMDNVKDLEDHESEYTKTQSFYDALHSGLAKFNSGIVKAPAMAYDLANLPRNIAAMALDAPSLERRSPDWLMNNPLAKYYDEQAKISHDNNPDLKADIIELASQKKWDKAGRALAAKVVENAPNSIILLMGGMSGLAKEGLVFAATTTAAQSASDPENQAAPAAASTLDALTKGGFEAGFENMGTLSVLKQWSEALTKSVGKQGVLEIFKSFTKMMASGFVQEGSEEVATGYAQDLTDYFTGINPDALEGINRRRVEEFLIGGASGTTMTAPAGLAMGYAQNRMKAQSDTMKNTYIAMGKSSEASKVRERLPAKYKEYVDHVTKNGQLENIHMPVEKFTELFQSYEGGLAGAIQDLGIEDSYNTAKESGGMVTVKLSAWTDKVVGTELFQRAADDITFDPNVFTQNEVKEFQKAVLDTSFDVEKFDAEKAVDGLTPMQQIERMLSSTGMDQASARKNAILMRGINQIAKNTGKTPEQLFGEYKLNITKPMAQPNVKNFDRGEVNKPDAYRILKNLRSGKKITDAKVGGQSLHQFIRKMGGIKNDEFAAEVRDLQKGKKGSGLTRANAKLSLDKMAEAANESGYIKAMDSAELLKAIEDEYLGSPRYSDQKINENLRAEQISQAQFKEYLDSIGVDLKTMTDEEIMDKIDEQNKARATSEVETYLQMAGRKSLTHNAEQLSKAEKMRVDGVDMETIRKETGWFMTPDNRWKYEISDEGVFLKEVKTKGSSSKSLKLSDVLDHPKLYEAYPDLKNYAIEIGTQRKDSGKRGHFQAHGKVIRVNLESEAKQSDKDKRKKQFDRLDQIEKTPEAKDFTDRINKGGVDGLKARAEFFDTELGREYKRLRVILSKSIKRSRPNYLDQSRLGTVMHEIQHAIQAIEKTTRGSSASGNTYWNNAGEVEARDADARKGLTDEERKQVTPALQTYKNPIIVWGEIEKEMPIEEAPVNVLEKIEIGEQMKLFQSKNKGSFDQNNENILYQSEQQPVAPFFSNLEKTIEAKMGGSAKVAEVLAIVKDVKEEEKKWLGLDDFLKGKEKVTKEDLLNFIRGNALNIKEVSSGDGVPVFSKGYDSIEALMEDVNGDTQLQFENGNLRPDLKVSQGEDGKWNLFDSSGEGSTKYSGYTLSGGSNYREVRFTLPENITQENKDLSNKLNAIQDELSVLDTKLADIAMSLHDEGISSEDFNRVGIERGLNTKEELDRAKLLRREREIIRDEINQSSRKNNAINYSSSHFPEKNIIAHTRLKDRIDSENKKVLFIEEIQSDLHQAGRKIGYIDQNEADKVQSELDKTPKPLSFPEWLNKEDPMFSKEYGSKIINTPSENRTPELNKLVKEYYDYANPIADKREMLRIKRFGLSDGVPDAPFKKTWHEFVLKRLIREAAEKGYDKIAWTTGEQQSERYDLSKTVDSLMAQKKPNGNYYISFEKQGEILREESNVKESELEFMLGKDLAEKIINNEGEKITAEDGSSDEFYNYSGADLKVGGSGMKGFYDKILVDFANKFGKKFGARVVDSKVKTGGYTFKYIGEVPTRDKIEELIKNAPNGRMYNQLRSLRDVSELSNDSLAKVIAPETAEYMGGKIEQIDIPETVHSLEITPAMKDAALNEGFSLFQGAESIKRGRILFDSNGNFNIEFLKDADSTTFLHEIGHFYLEVMRDQVNKGAANQKLQDDYAKILKHIGADGTKPFTVEQHEKFAESWEKYFAEGKAPTRELQSAFDTFKDWMMGVYRSILSMYPKVKLSDDVRGVFDRLLASEEEIERAKHELNASPMILNTDGIMTAEESAKYQRLIEEENQIARDKIRAEAMFSLKASETKKRKARASELKEQITKEVDAEPDQMILKMIKSGVIEGRGDLPAGYDNLKLNRKIAEALYDPKVLRGLPVGVMSPKGVHPDLLAQMFIGGNASGSDLVAMLANIEDRNEKIQRLVDEKMAEEFPDPTIDGTLSDKAIQALHNDASTERRLFEIDQMMKNKPAAVKGLVKKFHARRMTVAQFKNRAELTLGNIAVRDIKPYVYQRAEIRHSKDAMDKFLKGDFEGAIESKQMEIFNHELYKASIIATEEIEKGLISFSKTFQSDEKIAKTRNINYVNAARSILSMHGIGDADKGAEEYLGSVKAYDPDKYNEMMEYVTTATVNAKDHRDLSFNEFVQLKQVIDDLWSFAKLDNQITIDGKKFDRKQAQDEMITVMQGFNAAKKKEYKEFTGSLSESDITNIQFGALASSLKRVEFWCDRMDDGRVDGAFRKFIWNPISDGVIKYRLSKNNYIEKFRDLIKTHTAGFTEREILAPELSGRFALAEGEEGGEKYKFKNKTELLGAYLHVGNLSNKRKLLIGNGWGSLDENKELDSRAWDAFDKRMIAEGIMTKADYDFLQGVWDLMEELKPDAQKAHFELYGYYFSEVTSNEFTNQFGTYRGGYAPAAIDRNRTENTKASQKALEEGTDSSMFPAQVNGFTKKRVESYAVPLSMDLGLVPLHVDAVLRFTHITPRMKDVSRMLYDREFRSELKQFDPHIAEYVLKPWLDRSVKQSVVTPSGNKAADYIFRKLRSNVGMSTMFLNVTNTLQQYTGLFVAATKVSPKHLRNSSYNFIKHSKKMSEFAYEKSAFMKTKITFQLGETTKELQKILNKPTKTEKVSDWFKQNAYALQGMAQNQVDLIVWNASFNEAQEQGINEDQSVRIADSAVRMTQGTFAPEDVSSFETGTPMVRLFTMFTSYFNMLGNLLGSEYIKLVQNNLGIKKNASRAFYVYAVGFMLPAVISGLIVRGMSGKGLDGDDDDSYLDDFIALFFGEQLKTATALVPVAGQLANASYAKFTKEQWDDRISLSPSVSMLEAAVGVPYDIVKAYEDGQINKRGVKDSLTLLSLMSGIPVAPLSKPIGYMMDVQSGNANPKNPVDYSRGLISGKAGN